MLKRVNCEVCLDRATRRRGDGDAQVEKVTVRFTMLSLNEQRFLVDSWWILGGFLVALQLSTDVVCLLYSQLLLRSDQTWTMVEEQLGKE